MSNSMNIVPPVVGTTPGPQWANEINSILENQVAPHTHTGTPDGSKLNQNALDFTADLSLDNQGVVDVKLVEYNDTGIAPAVAGSTYRLGTDLYYRDGTGTAVRLTLGGAVNSNSSGQISGMNGTNATAKFASLSTFEWRKYEVGGITQWANQKNGNVYIYNPAPSNPLGAVVLTNPHTLTSDKTLLLPPNSLTLPQTNPASATSFLQLSPAGVMTHKVPPAAQVSLNLGSTNFTNVFATGGISLGTVTLTGTGQGYPLEISIGARTNNSINFSTEYLYAYNTTAASENTIIDIVVYVKLTLGNGTIRYFQYGYRLRDPSAYNAVNNGIWQPFVPSIVYVPTVAESTGTISVNVSGYLADTTNHGASLQNSALYVRETLV